MKKKDQEPDLVKNRRFTKETFGMMNKHCMMSMASEVIKRSYGEAIVLWREKKCIRIEFVAIKIHRYLHN